MNMVKIRDMQLGDIIDLGLPEGYGTATVQEANEERVVLLRPYVSHTDFSCSNNKVITYLGWEECIYYLSSQGDLKYPLLRRLRTPVR